MALPAFDTHAYVKRLKAAGFNEAQAEAQAELQSQVLSALVTEKLATKDDIANLKRDIADVKRDVKEDIMRFEHETKQEFVRLEATFNGKFNLLNWMLGFLVVGVMTTLFKLFMHG
jgi:hypothetical protein